MRTDLELKPFNSERVYGLVEQVYAVVTSGVDFDMKYISWLWFEGFVERVATPNKQMILHETIHAVAFCYLEYSTRKFPRECVDDYRSLLKEAKMAIPKWLTKKQVESHVCELDPMLAKASEILVPPVFHVLFSDRDFVTIFQSRIAELACELKHADFPELLLSDGIFKRPNYIPTWLKAAIFHRDHGRCQHCWKDLTGLGSPVTDLHLDHIVPLAQSGSNDPTNFQLSCRACNLKKGKKNRNTPGRYTPYW